MNEWTDLDRPWLEVSLDDADEKSFKAAEEAEGLEEDAALGGRLEQALRLSEGDSGKTNDGDWASKLKSKEDEILAPRRLKGLRVGLNLNYYNFGQAPGLEKKFTFDAGEVVCVLELELLEDTAEVVGGKLEQASMGEVEEDEKAEGEKKAALAPAEEEEEKKAKEEAELAEWEGKKISSYVTGRESASRQSRDAGAAETRKTRMKPVYNNKGVKLGEAEVEEEEGEDDAFTKLDMTEVQYFVQTSAAVGRGAYVIRHKDGIRISVTGGGVISELDAALLFETFIQAFLLLNLANIICKFIAFNCLGIKSKVFYNYGEYKVNYEEEYARFAVQSIVAAQAFKRLDVDNSGSLSEEEIVTALLEAQGPDTRFSKADIDSLAAFIVACGDQDGEDGEDPDGEINMAEWDDLFASGFATSKLISEQIDVMKKDRCASCTDGRENFIDRVERRQVFLGKKKSSKKLQLKMQKGDYYGSLGDGADGADV